MTVLLSVMYGITIFASKSNKNEGISCDNTDDNSHVQ